METDTARALAGTTFIAGGVLVALGFTTAEAFYPGYSTTTQTISALGAADSTAASRLVFNGVMVLSGLLTVVAAYGVHQVYEDRAVTFVLAATGLFGNTMVGLFPAQTGLPHLVGALVAFGGSGLGAIIATRIIRGPFRYVSLSLGVAILGTLVVFMTVQGGTVLGVGGLERWVAYLALAWVLGFGGYVLGDTHTKS